jgi:hypothetical protein
MATQDFDEEAIAYGLNGTALRRSNTVWTANVSKYDRR